MNCIRRIKMLAILSLFLLSCTNKKDESKSSNEEFLSIKISDSDGVRQNFDDLFTGLTFIPLETTEESLIGRVTGFKTSDDYIYLVDNSDELTIFCFDFEGRFVRKNIIAGEGPEQLSTYKTFCIHPKTKDISILGFKKVLVLDSDLNFKRSKELSITPCDFDQLPNGDYAFAMPYRDKQIIVTDSSFNLKSELFESLDHSRDYISDFITQGNDQLYIHLPTRAIDTIYSLDNSGVHKRFCPEYDFKGLDANDAKPFIFRCDNYFENERFIYFSFSYPHTRSCLYDKKKKSFVIIDSCAMDNAPMAGLENYRYLDEKGLYTIVPVNDVLNFINIAAKSKYLEKCIELKSKLSADDNPIIVLSELD